MQILRGRCRSRSRGFSILRLLREAADQLAPVAQTRGSGSKSSWERDAASHAPLGQNATRGSGREVACAGGAQTREGRRPVWAACACAARRLPLEVQRARRRQWRAVAETWLLRSLIVVGLIVACKIVPAARAGTRVGIDECSQAPRAVDRVGQSRSGRRRRDARIVCVGHLDV
jgi:hypothetical protein